MSELVATYQRPDPDEGLRAFAAEMGGNVPTLTTETTPNATGVVLLSDETRHIIAESPALTVAEEYLTPLDSAEQDYEELIKSDLVGDLMQQARLSKLTGCIMRVDRYRNDKGYTRTGIKAVRELGLGSTSREAHRVVHFARMAEQTGKLPDAADLSKQVDHICRNPACLYHTRLLEPKENNSLRAEAARIEPIVTSGQMLYAADLLDELPWLTFSLAEDGELPAKAISTRLGPFCLRLAHTSEAIVYGDSLGCDAYDALKPLGKARPTRKSRATLKVPTPIQDHKVLFPKTKYRKHKIPNQKVLYERSTLAA